MKENLSNLKASLLLLAILYFMGTPQTLGQKGAISITTGLGVSDQTFLFDSQKSYDAVAPWLEAVFVYNIEAAYDLIFENRFLLSTSIGYRYMSMDYNNSEFRDFRGIVNDYKPERSVRNYGVVSLLMGYATKPARAISFRFAAGPTLSLPFNCFDEVTHYTGEQGIDDRYSGSGNDGFKEGVLYGSRLQLQTVYNPWFRQSKRRLFFVASVFGELLFYTEADYNPKYLGGLSLGISYSIK